MTPDREPLDPALGAMLRENLAETPPAHVDAAIMRAAHRAVVSAPRAHSRRPWRLWLPLAAAATVTAVVIGLQSVERQAPEGAPAANVPLKASTEQSATRSDESNAAADAPPPQSPAAATSAPPAAESARQSDAARVTKAQVSQDPRVKEAIERIRAFRRDGRETEAVAALAQLRATVSDADVRLPPDLRAWASTVPR